MALGIIDTGFTGGPMETMRKLSISLPVEMLDRLKMRAEKEDRTVDELAGEALRRYEAVQSLRELQEYGNKRTLEFGIKEEDVHRIIHEYRAEKRALLEATGVLEPVAS
jgi:predicted transcriptional regulator